MKKLALYAAVFGKRCNWRRPRHLDPNMDRFFYTDLEITNDFYQIKRIRLDHLDPVRRNRFVKICIPDEIFNNYEYSYYMDYKHGVAVDFDYLLSFMGSDSDMLISKHKKRGCVYDEGRICVEGKKDKREVILRQLDFYRSEGYPVDNGLYGAYWLFRRHTKELREFMKRWWEQVEKYSYRDQISLPYVAWKHGVKISSYKRPK